MTYRDETETLRSANRALEQSNALLRNQLAEAIAESRDITNLANSAARAQKVAAGTATAMRWTGAAFGASLAVAAVFGIVRSCEAALPADATGVVTDRYHHHAYTTTSCTGNPPHCTTVAHPERWSLRIARDGHDREADVPEEQWSHTQLGALWCANPPCRWPDTSEER